MMPNVPGATGGLQLVREGGRRAGRHGLKTTRGTQTPAPRGRRAGFTLVELLVVITIIVLVSAATLPTVLPALAHRQVSEAARILQAALAGARDAAIRDNAPRGVRLLPDPLFNGSISTTTLAYNRFVPIETAGDYTTGMVTLTFPQGVGTNPTPYVESPFPSPGNAHLGLRVDESPFYNVTPAIGTPYSVPNERTSWFWNIRIGDKIRFNDSGRFYTVVGPAVINPFNSSGSNPELFVNDGPLGKSNVPARVVTDLSGNSYYREYLYLVNGEDDPLIGQTTPDGFVDNGWDGLNNDYDFFGTASMYDEYDEWEAEQWTGAELYNLLATPPDPVTGIRTISNIKYTISRRPTPVPGAREITLPGGVVVDATTWNSTQERSRLPIDPKTSYVDILINTNGQVVPTTEYSSPSASSRLPFYHFWLAERQDVHETTDLWGVKTAATATAPPVPNANPNSGSSYLLPLPKAYYSSMTPPPNVALEGDRRLLTLFTRTGQLTSNTLEIFSLLDTNAPFYAAQTGTREAK